MSAQRLLGVGLGLFLVGAAAVAHARPFRVAQVPNGAVNSCLTCHVGTGGPRNPFGQTIQGGFLDPEGNVLWGPALAALDSDSDGTSNGGELLDPAGSWGEGQPDPGTPAAVRRPGVPDAPAAVPALTAHRAALLAGLLLLLGMFASRCRTVVAR